MSFDPVSTAKTLIGELSKEAGTDFGTALLLQAGLRVLLPSEELEGVAAPKVFPNDLPELQALQGVVIDRLNTGREATHAEQVAAREALISVSAQLSNQEMASGITAMLAPAAKMKIENGRLNAAGEKPTRDDFDTIASELGVKAGFAVKVGNAPVAAMNIVDVATFVTTINTKDGTVQAEKMAQPGDAIMTRLNKDGTPKFGETGELDQWVVDAEKLERLYNPLGNESEYGQVVGGNNEVYFVELSNGGIIEAPWGGPQEISAGVLQYSLTTNEVYLNESDAFESTFNIKSPSVRIESSQSPSDSPKSEFNYD